MTGIMSLLLLLLLLLREKEAMAIVFLEGKNRTKCAPLDSTWMASFSSFVD